MTSTKERPGPFDGLERAAPDEPVFTLRAHDIHAAALVHEWVRLRRAAIAAAALPDEKRALELIQVKEAEEIAWSMTDWRDGRQAEPAVSPTAAPARYSGNTMSVDELAAKRRFDQTKEAGRLLRNAAAEIAEASDIMRDLGIDVTDADSVCEIVNSVAEMIEPKRASYAYRA